jgi:hypothetical protein
MTFALYRLRDNLRVDTPNNYLPSATAFVETGVKFLSSADGCTPNKKQKNECNR